MGTIIGTVFLLWLFLFSAYWVFVGTRSVIKERPMPNYEWIESLEQWHADWNRDMSSAIDKTEGI